MAEYPTLQSHAEAFLHLLRDQQGLTVYPAEEGGTQVVPHDAPPPYVMVRFAAARAPGGRLDQKSTRLRTRAYTYAVGATDIAARAVSDLIAAAVLDVRPDIPGRNCAPIRHEPGGYDEPRENETTGATTATIAETWRLESTPG